MLSRLIESVRAGAMADSLILCCGLKAFYTLLVKYKQKHLENLGGDSWNPPKRAASGTFSCPGLLVSMPPC